MYLKIIILIQIFIICGCTSNHDENTVIHFRNSKISSYFGDFDNVQPIDGECLDAIRLSLIGVIWKESTTVKYAISFNPKNKENSYYHLRGQQIWLCFLINENTESGTKNSYEAYFYNSYLHSFKPCYFENNDLLRVDTLIEIVPKLEYLKDNCILNISRTDLDAGVFEKIDYLP